LVTLSPITDEFGNSNYWFFFFDNGTRRTPVTAPNVRVKEGRDKLVDRRSLPDIYSNENLAPIYIDATEERTEIEERTERKRKRKTDESEGEWTRMGCL
jgi:hypothetical protein